jgi:Tfp pilus tip-associated adhesin PilY1
MTTPALDRVSRRTGSVFVLGEHELGKPAGDLQLVLQEGPTSKIPTAVQNTCAAGYVQDWSSGKDNGSVTSKPLAYNYNFIASSDLPNAIANQQATATPTRGKAIPIVYSLKLTQNGLLSMSYSYNGGAATPIITNQDITKSNGPVPTQFRFGFAAGTGSGSNVHEITCFKAEPVGQSSSSAGTNVQQSARVEAGSQVYLAYYHPTNWWGELSAQNLLYDASSDTVSMSTTANWNASCVLTGGSCPSTGGTNTAQSPTARKILTWSGSTGIPFRWDSTYTPPAAVADTHDRGRRQCDQQAPELSARRPYQRDHDIRNGFVSRTHGCAGRYHGFKSDLGGGAFLALQRALDGRPVQDCHRCRAERQL